MQESEVRYLLDLQGQEMQTEIEMETACCDFKHM